MTAARRARASATQVALRSTYGLLLWWCGAVVLALLCFTPGPIHQRIGEWIDGSKFSFYAAHMILQLLIWAPVLLVLCSVTACGFSIRNRRRPEEDPVAAVNAAIVSLLLALPWLMFFWELFTELWRS